MRLRILVGLFISFISLSAYSQQSDSIPWAFNKTIRIGKVSVMIQIPDSVKGYIMVLPGWNYPNTDWPSKTALCSLAHAMKLGLLIPDMKKSIYATNDFKETDQVMKAQLKRSWVKDSLIQYVQDSFGIFLKGQNNFVIGLSTGAHGAALLVEDLPELFTGVALLSGDYDQRKLPYDKIYIATYGAYHKFPQRWALDNPQVNLKSFKTPVYIAHGYHDAVIPVNQSRTFYFELKKMHPSLKVEYSFTPGGHQYSFWSSETIKALNFFNRLIQR